MEIEEAVKLITDEVSQITEEEWVSIEDACGRIISRDIRSADAVPSFPRSAMDGYGVFSEDVKNASKEDPVLLKVKEEISAGDFSRSSYSPGTAVRVMTGAMIPEGYDAVVKQEDTDYGEETVSIYSPVKSHGNYCLVGEEIKAGETVIKAGRRIGRTETGLLVSVGLTKVPVRRPARVALISTGSELADPCEELRPGQIYNSILYVLLASIKHEGLEAGLSKTVPDDTDVIKESIEEAAETSDVIITTGGVSVGKKDLIPEVLQKLGAGTVFRGVNIQPGTPTMGSIYRNKVILSLSGNPFAALACFDLYFWPVISKLMGNESYTPKVYDAVLSQNYEKINKMRRLVRAKEECGSVSLPVSEHMSSVFGNTSLCNCYIDVPAGNSLAMGDTVTVRKMKESF